VAVGGPRDGRGAVTVEISHISIDPAIARWMNGGPLSSTGADRRVMRALGGDG